MCMSKVTLTLKKGKDGEYYGVGYKRITKDEKGMLRKPFPRGSRLCIGRWVEDKNTSSIMNYASGFHLFLNRQDAVDYNSTDRDIYEVYFKNIVAVGEEKAFPLYGSISDIATGRTCVIVRKAKVVKLV